MATFYYYKRAKLHLCNDNMKCPEERFVKLKEKGKITEESIKKIFLIQKYRLLTLKMLSVLTDTEESLLHQELEQLVNYGLIIKQFFECTLEDENVRTETFYAAAQYLPEEAFNKDKKNDFVWSTDIRMEEAMSILAFNQFHIAFTRRVPKAAMQSQMDYIVRNVHIDGRYRLKSRKYILGYSHLFVCSVRDFAEQNHGIREKIKTIQKHYRYGNEKMPWFILVCENRPQCAFINRLLKTDAETKDIAVYYLLDTDIDFDENPLDILSIYRFANEEKEIVSEVFKAEAWY